DDLDAALFRVDLVHGADEVFERAIDDTHRLAGDVSDTNARLLHAHGAQDVVHLIVRKRDGTRARRDEAGDAGGVPDHMPGFIGIGVAFLELDRLDEDVAGIELALHGAALAITDLDLVFGGD